MCTPSDLGARGRVMDREAGMDLWTAGARPQPHTCMDNLGSTGTCGSSYGRGYATANVHIPGLPTRPTTPTTKITIRNHLVKEQRKSSSSRWSCAQVALLPLPAGAHCAASSATAVQAAVGRRRRAEPVQGDGGQVERSASCPRAPADAPCPRAPAPNHSQTPHNPRDADHLGRKVGFFPPCWGDEASSRPEGGIYPTLLRRWWASRQEVGVFANLPGRWRMDRWSPGRFRGWSWPRGRRSGGGAG